MRLTQFMYGLLGLAYLTQAVPVSESASRTSLAPEVQVGQDSLPMFEASIATIESANDATDTTAIADLDDTIYPLPGDHLAWIFPRDNKKNHYALVKKDQSGICLKLPQVIDHHVSHILQARGMSCAFYRGTCIDANLVAKFDELPYNWRNDLNQGDGSSAAFVRCEKTNIAGPPSMIKARTSTTTVEPIDNNAEHTTDVAEIDTASNIFTGGHLVVIIPTGKITQYDYIDQNKLGRCLKLNDGIAYHVRGAIHEHNIKCSLYTSLCEDAQHVVTFGKLSYTEFFDATKEEGARSGVIRCERIPDTPMPSKAKRDEIESSQVLGNTTTTTTQEDSHVLDGDLQVSSLDSTAAASTALGPPLWPLHPGDIHACAEEERFGCEDVVALDSCKSFGLNIAYRIKEMRQVGGSVCKYYTKSGCQDKDEHFRHAAKSLEVALLTGNHLKKVGAVSCRAAF